jgi:hypothetical protein
MEKRKCTKKSVNSKTHEPEGYHRGITSTIVSASKRRGAASLTQDTPERTETMLEKSSQLHVEIGQ